MEKFQDTMLEIVNHALVKHPELCQPILDLARQHLQNRERKLEEVFSHVYANNLWGSAESLSGQGSELIYTENLRAQLPKLFDRYRIGKVLDAPCGDFNWMKLVLKKVSVDYVGADIVPDLVKRNNDLYRSNSIRFRVLDVTKDDLPDADLLICRDCLFHLSFLNVKRFVENFKRSKVKYLLTTSHERELVPRNVDVPDGGFRLIDLYAPPFNFPLTPLETIEDWIPGFPKRQMILWSHAQLSEIP